MNILNLITADIALTEKTASELADYLNAKTLILKRTDSILSFKGVTIKEGVDFTRSILGKLKAAADGTGDPILAAAYLAMTSVGLDFAHPMTQGMIDTMEAMQVFTPQEAASLKNLGTFSASKIEEMFGEGQVLSVEDAGASLAAWNRQQLTSRFATRYNQIQAQIATGSIMDWTAVVAAVSAE
jgi:hypothetical protein